MGVVKQYFELKNQIEDILLDFADTSQEVTRSDLQGIATVKAQEIINIVNEVEE